MFDSVVVGVDGRPAGRDAIALARMLADPQGRVVLAHVHPHGHGSRSSHDAAQSERSRVLLERERAAADLQAEVRCVAAPSAGHGLHELVERLDADLLVVGSCSRGFAGRVLLGNDTRDAMRDAPCAVAVAPVGYERDLSSLATIGVGYDGSPASRAALFTARRLAGERDAGLRALQVVPLPAAPYAGFAGVVWTEALDGMMADARRDLAALPDVQGDAVLGLTEEELASFSGRVDLLVVGCHASRRRRRPAFGSILGHLAGHSSCPLLALPPRRREGAPEGEPAAAGVAV